MGRIVLPALAFAVTASSCAPPQRGVTHVVWPEGNSFYVAYVEDVTGAGIPYATRLQRCTINADNTATCVPEAAANALLTPGAPPATVAATGSPASAPTAGTPAPAAPATAAPPPAASSEPAPAAPAGAPGPAATTPAPGTTAPPPAGSSVPPAP